MSMPRSPRGVDSITLGTITPLGSIISRVALIHLGSFGLKMVPIFSPYNIRNDLSLFLLYRRSQTIGKTECAEEPYKSKVMYRYHSTCKIQTQEIWALFWHSQAKSAKIVSLSWDCAGEILCSFKDHSSHQAE